MVHDGYLFEFPGRGYVLANPEFAHELDVAALRAIIGVVEPTVVEALDDSQDAHHLVAGMAEGGMYTRAPVRTTSVDRIDAEVLVGWFEGILHERPNNGLTGLWISDGWYAVDAHPGDVLRLRTSVGTHDVAIVEHEGRGAVRVPVANVVEAPLRFELDLDGGELKIAVQWSPWSDIDGIGHARFARLLATLTSAGWKLEKEPSPSSLDWRRGSAPS
jgi:hypothetical protein